MKPTLLHWPGITRIDHNATINLTGQTFDWRDVIYVAAHSDVV